MNPVFFASLDDLHQWFTENHDQVQELWIGFYKKNSGKPTVTYKEAVDEALCFGWIDGIRKSIDAESYVNRFTPRRPKSNWSAVNIKRVGELSEMGRMQPSGVKAFEARAQGDLAYSYEQAEKRLDPAYEAQFRQHEKAWEYFESQGAYYRKAASHWVMSARQEATRQKRLSTLIADSENGQKVAPLRPTSQKK